jgi:hypothetical protein
MPVLGMRGTGSFSSDERPKNYREGILRLDPNTKAGLMAFLGMIPDAETTDPEFKWFEKGLLSQRVTVSGSQTSGDLTIELTGTEPAKVLKKGHALRNERTDEVIWVMVDPISPWTSISVARGKGSTAAAMNDLDGLLIVGSHYQEGAELPTAITYDPSVKNNFCQIFRDTIDLTKTAIATELRTAKPLKEAQRDALELHETGQEKAFIWGTGVEDTSGDHPERTTKGVLGFVSTNVKDFADAVSIDSWENFLQDVFKYGSNEKVAFVGNVVMTIISRMARVHGTLEIVPTTETFGMNIMRWLTPSGTLMLKAHPLFNENATYKDWGFILDRKFVRYRYLRGRDTKYDTDIGNPGDDARRDQYLTECGLELSHETAHAVLKNASAFVP